MRWEKLTRYAVWEKKFTWHREFAWWPRWDHDSCTKYWMEYVWRRRVHRRRFGYATLYEWAWEYRGGKEAPEVKRRHPLVTAANARDKKDWEGMYGCAGND